MRTWTRRSFLGHSAAAVGAAALPRAGFATERADWSGGIDTSRELVLVERPAEDGIRDAVNVWLESDEADLGLRIGVEALAEEWDAHDLWLDMAFASGRVLQFRGSGPVHAPVDGNGRPSIRGAGPTRFQCVEPFQTWTVSFAGTVSETTAMELARDRVPENPPKTGAEFFLEMSMAAPPWISGSLLPESRATMAGDQGEFMSPRYEQLFRAEGWIRVDGSRRDFRGRGLRIRRQGFRKFQGFWGHCWQSAVFPSGKGFGFNIYPPRKDGKPNFNEGFVFEDGKRTPARAVEIPWLDRLQAHGDAVPFALETVDGRRIEVEGETFINTRSLVSGQTVLPPDFPIVQQAHARYRWDGEETVGMVERSSAPDLIAFPD